MRESRVLFDHLRSEAERHWLYETYEKVIDSDIAPMTLTQALTSKDKELVLLNNKRIDSAKILRNVD